MSMFSKFLKRRAYFKIRIRKGNTRRETLDENIKDLWGIMIVCEILCCLRVFVLHLYGLFINLLCFSFFFFKSEGMAIGCASKHVTKCSI